MEAEEPGHVWLHDGEGPFLDGAGGGAVGGLARHCRGGLPSRDWQRAIIVSHSVLPSVNVVTYPWYSQGPKTSLNNGVGFGGVVQGS